MKSMPEQSHDLPPKWIIKGNCKLKMKARYGMLVKMKMKNNMTRSTLNYDADIVVKVVAKCVTGSKQKKVKQDFKLKIIQLLRKKSLIHNLR